MSNVNMRSRNDTDGNDEYAVGTRFHETDAGVVFVYAGDTVEQ